MAAFDYKALDAKGASRKGHGRRQCAPDPSATARQGINALEVEPAAEKQNRAGAFRRQGGRMNAASLALITRQLATLIQSGIPIEEALGRYPPRLKATRFAVSCWRCVHASSKGTR